MPTKLVTYGFYALFGLLPLAYSPDLVEGGILPRLILLILIILFWSFTLFKSSNYTFTLSSYALLGLALLYILSSVWANNVSESLATGFKWLIFSFYFLVAQHAFRERWIKRQALLQSTLFFAAGISVASLFHFKTGSVDHGAIAITFGHENILSGVLILIIPILVTAALSFKKDLLKAVAALFGLMALGLLSYIGTRTALLALGIMIFYVIATLTLKSKLVSRVILGGALTLSILSGFLGSQLADTPISDTFDTRTRLWESSVALFQEYPLTGVGAGNWKTEYQKFGLNKFGVKLINGETNVARPHNDFIWVLTELGIIGGVLWILFFSGPIRTQTHSESDHFKEAILQSTVAGFFILGIFSFPGERITHMVLILTVTAYLTRQEKPFQLELNSKAVHLPVIILSAAALFIAGTRYRSEIHVQKARKEFLRKNAQSVIYNAHEGYSTWYNLDPTVTPVKYYEGMGHMLNQQPEKALTCFQLAEKANPYYINALINKGVAYTRLEQYDSAIETYHHILAFSEGFHKASVNLAEIYLIRQDIKNGWRVIKKVPYYQMDTDPKFAEVLYRILANRIYQATREIYSTLEITQVVEDKEQILKSYRYCRENGNEDCLDQLLIPFQAFGKNAE